MVFGQDKKIEFFKGLVSEKKLGQAYLFYGEPQVGKFHFVKHLAYFLEYGEFEIIEKPLLDAVFVEVEEEKKSIGIDRVREIKRFLFQKPFRSEKRLVVINDAGLLTQEAQSGLLKFVEESPSCTVFVFIANSPESLLPPLASRLQRIYFPRLSVKELKDVVKKEYGLSEDKALVLAGKSFGRIGRALDLMNKKKGDDEEDLGKFIEERILSLFLKDKVKNAGILSWLIKKETEIKRFTLNPKLQKKVIEQKRS